MLTVIETDQSEPNWKAGEDSWGQDQVSRGRQLGVISGQKETAVGVRSGQEGRAANCDQAGRGGWE